MIETDSKIPVPEPMAPTRSDITEMIPIHIPPQVAATGMYRFKTVNVEES